MDPKDQAREIFNEMYGAKDQMGSYPMCFETAKTCAMIAVKNIIKSFELYGSDLEFEMIYWELVMGELIILKN